MASSASGLLCSPAEAGRWCEVWGVPGVVTAWRGLRRMPHSVTRWSLRLWVCRKDWGGGMYIQSLKTRGKGQVPKARGNSVRGVDSRSHAGRCGFRRHRVRGHPDRGDHRQMLGPAWWGAQLGGAILTLPELSSTPHRTHSSRCDLLLLTLAEVLKINSLF